MITKAIDRFRGVLEDKHFGEVFKGSFITFLARVIAVVLNLLTNLIVARYYGSETLGAVTLVMSFFAITGLFVTVGLNTSLLRLIPEQLEKNSIVQARAIFWISVRIVFVTGFLVSLVSWLNVPLLANKFFNNANLELWLYVAVFLIIVVNLSGICTSAIRAFKKIELFSALQLLQPLVTVIFLGVTTFWFYNAYNPFYAYFLSIIIGGSASVLLVLYVFNDKKISGGQTGSAGYNSLDIINISWPMFLTSGMYVVISQTDIVMLGAMTKAEDVGVYAIVMKLGLAVSFILTSINMVLGPKFAELYYRDDMKGLALLAKQSSKLTFYCTTPFLLVLILFGKPILGLFGEEFIEGYMALVFIALGQFVNTICGSVGYFLNMTGYQKIFNRIVSLGAILNVLLNLVLIPVYGIAGAATASLLSVCLWNFVALLYIKSKFGFYMGYVPSLKRAL